MRFLLVMLLCLLFWAPPAKAEAGKVVYVTLWAEYMPAWVWQEFQQETNIRVINRFYAQRTVGCEQIIKSMPQNDLALICFEHVQMLQQQDLIAPIDYTKLKNKQNLQLSSLPEEFTRQFSHGVPFDWHVLGLVVNSKLLNPARFTRFAALWEPDVRGKVYLPEDHRVLASLGLTALGFSCNSTDPQQLAQAKSKIEQLLPYADGVSNYGLLDALARGSTAVGVVWSGMSANAFLDRLPNLKFVLPEGRKVLLSECWVVSAQAGNPEGAYALIDFLMRPDIARRLARETGYPTINTRAQIPKFIVESVIYNPPVSLLQETELEAYVPEISDYFKDVCRILQQ